MKKQQNTVAASPGFFVVGHIVYLIIGIIELLLAFRFLLALLGANRSNEFAAFIFDMSTPLVAPFQGLFNFQTVYGSPRFEVETLIALLVYALIGAIIGALVRPPAART